jgi:molybdopterin biosynthesis enzyme
MLDLSRKAVTWMVLSVVLFIALSPGVLLTVPSIDGSLANMLTSNAPSTQVVVHAVVCAVLINLAGGVLKKMGVLVEKFGETPYQRRQREYAERQRVVLENERQAHLQRDQRGRR